MNRPVSLMLWFAAAVLPAACGTGNDGASPSASPSPSAAAHSSASTAAGAVASVPVTTTPPILASGVNPDWSILIDSGVVVVRSFDGSQRMFPALKFNSAGRSANFSMGAGSRSASLQLDPGPCPQDAAAMSAQASIDGRSAGGCGRHLQVSAAGASDWTTTLFDFVPALRACLARAQVDDASANNVMTQPDGMLLIVVRDLDGSRFNCTASPNGSTLQSFEAAPAEDSTPDVVPAFSRSAAAFTRLGCDEPAMEVVSNSGELLGYVQRGHCGDAPQAPPP